MFRRALTLCVVLAFASVAQGAAVIELTALTAPNAADGVHYVGGTTVDFQAAISTDTGAAVGIRGLTLAFQDSSPQLTLVDPFRFDFSTANGGVMYTQFANYPLPNATYTQSIEIGGFMLKIPASGSLVIGAGSVVLPMADGVYTVDALNDDSTDSGMNDTARLDYDFANPKTLAANGFGFGLVTGQPLALAVPEPATLLLLGLGGVAVLRRRR